MVTIWDSSKSMFISQRLGNKGSACEPLSVKPKMHAVLKLLLLFTEYSI